jgi:hypothetical protein
MTESREGEGSERGEEGSRERGEEGSRERRGEEGGCTDTHDFQELDCHVTLWADYSDSAHEANLDSYTTVGKGLLLGAYTSAIHEQNPLAFGSDGTSSWKWLCYNEALYQGKGRDYQEEAAS